MILSCEKENIEEWEGIFALEQKPNIFIPCGIVNEEFWVLIGDKMIINNLHTEATDLDCENKMVLIKVWGKRFPSLNQFELTNVQEINCGKFEDCECDCEKNENN